MWNSSHLSWYTFLITGGNVAVVVDAHTIRNGIKRADSTAAWGLEWIFKWVRDWHEVARFRRDQQNWSLHIRMGNISRHMDSDGINDIDTSDSAHECVFIRVEGNWEFDVCSTDVDCSCIDCIDMWVTDRNNTRRFFVSLRFAAEDFRWDVLSDLQNSFNLGNPADWNRAHASCHEFSLDEHLSNQSHSCRKM